MDGAIGTRMEAEYGLTPDNEIALAAHACSDAGRKALTELWTGYADAAKKRKLPFLVNTPTRKANRERVEHSRFSPSIIGDNVRFLRSVFAETDLAKIRFGGTVGCRGDAYTGAEGIDAEQARQFHAWTIERFADAGVDYIYAGIMPNLPETTGLVRACADAGLPCIISFMIRRDGRIVDGTPLHDAIAETDACSARQPVCYSTNCVHPDTVSEALTAKYNQTSLVRERFLGIMPNASPLPPDQLDGSGTLYQSSPEELAGCFRKLLKRMNVKIVGGCCGTDQTHLAALADATLENTAIFPKEHR